MHVLRHGSVRVSLDDEIHCALLVYVADGSVRSNNGLLHFGTLVLGDDGSYTKSVSFYMFAQGRNTSYRQTALHVLFRQLEGKLLGVVVDNLRLVQHKRQEALVASGEGLLSRATG